MGLDWRMQSRINDGLEDDCLISNPSNLRGDASGEHRNPQNARGQIEGKAKRKRA